MVAFDFDRASPEQDTVRGGDKVVTHRTPPCQSAIATHRPAPPSREKRVESSLYLDTSRVTARPIQMINREYIILLYPCAIYL